MTINKNIEELREDFKDISDFVSEPVLLAKIHIHRKKGTATLSKRMMGIKTDNVDVDEFFKTYTDDGRVYLIPDKRGSVGARLNSLTSTIRQKLTALAIDTEGTMLTVDGYVEFKEFLSIKEEEFYGFRDEISKNWYIYYNQFVRQLRTAFSLLDKVEAESNISKILASMPTKEDFVASFNIRFNVLLLPGSDVDSIKNQSVLDDLKAGRENEVLQTLNSVIAKTLNDAFQKIASAYESTDHNAKKDLSVVPGRTLTALSNVPHELRSRKVLKDSEFMIEKLAVSFEELVEKVRTATDKIATLYDFEIVASTILGFAFDLGMEESIKFKKGSKSKDIIFDKDDLLEIYEYERKKLALA